MKYFLSFLTITSLILLTSCEKKDEDIANFNVCDEALSFTEADKSDINVLSTDQIPVSVRSFIAGELAGYEITSVTSFEVQTIGYLEVEVDQGGKLLFDGEGSFLCGDDTFAQGNYDDDDDDDEYINPSDLPQAILDYIAQNYPNAAIEEAELEYGVYEVELDNDVELCFDLQGNFTGNDC